MKMLVPSKDNLVYLHVKWPPKHLYSKNCSTENSNMLENHA